MQTQVRQYNRTALTNTVTKDQINTSQNNQLQVLHKHHFKPEKNYEKLYFEVTENSKN